MLICFYGKQLTDWFPSWTNCIKYKFPWWCLVLYVFWTSLLEVASWWRHNSRIVRNTCHFIRSWRRRWIRYFWATWRLFKMKILGIRHFWSIRKILRWFGTLLISTMEQKDKSTSKHIDGFPFSFSTHTSKACVKY